MTRFIWCQVQFFLTSSWCHTTSLNSCLICGLHWLGNLASGNGRKWKNYAIFTKMLRFTLLHDVFFCFYISNLTGINISRFAVSVFWVIIFPYPQCLWLWKHHLASVLSSCFLYFSSCMCYWWFSWMFVLLC